MDIDTHNELETKAGIPLDAVVTHGELMRAFEVFKDANDEPVTFADKRSGDVVLEGFKRVGGRERDTIETNDRYGSTGELNLRAVSTIQLR